MEDRDWRLIDHSTNVAMAHAWQWALAVRAQAGRVSDGGRSLQQIPDAYLLVISLRNVRRAADMAWAHLTDTAAKGQLREALGDFDDAVPMR
jgi:hypothetical protein